MHLPQLGRVPGPTSQHQLSLKATTSGITILKESLFRRRYTGNKHSAVDINGQLWLRSADLKRAIAGAVDKPKRKGKKKGPVETAPAGNKLNAIQISEDLSTPVDTLLTIPSDLSPTERPPREYRVHKREVRQRLLGFLNTQAGKKELYFWTVTFPAGTPDDLIYKIFNNWLTQLRQRRMLREYLWIAERQDGKRNDFKSATNTLHFHIAIPHKMPVQRANSMMRGTLKTFARRGELPFSVYQCNRYNGVDIAKNRTTKRVTNFAIKKGSRALVTYLTKYVTKNDGSFRHLAWHNSRGFSSIFTGVTFTIPEFEAHGWGCWLDEWKLFETDFFIFVPWSANAPPPLTEHLYEINSCLQDAFEQERMEREARKLLKQKPKIQLS